MATLQEQLSSSEIETALTTLAEAYRAGLLATIDDDLSGSQFAVAEKLFNLYRDAHSNEWDDDEWGEQDEWDEEE